MAELRVGSAGLITSSVKALDMREKTETPREQPKDSDKQSDDWKYLWISKWAGGPYGPAVGPGIKYLEKLEGFIKQNISQLKGPYRHTIDHYKVLPERDFEEYRKKFEETLKKCDGTRKVVIGQKEVTLFEECFNQLKAYNSEISRLSQEDLGNLLPGYLLNKIGAMVRWGEHHNYVGSLKNNNVFGSGMENFGKGFQIFYYLVNGSYPPSAGEVSDLVKKIPALERDDLVVELGGYLRKYYAREKQRNIFLDYYEGTRQLFDALIEREYCIRKYGTPPQWGISGVLYRNKIREKDKEWYKSQENLENALRRVIAAREAYETAFKEGWSKNLPDGFEGRFDEEVFNPDPVAEDALEYSYNRIYAQMASSLKAIGDYYRIQAKDNQGNPTLSAESKDLAIGLYDLAEKYLNEQVLAPEKLPEKPARYFDYLSLAHLDWMEIKIEKARYLLSSTKASDREEAKKILTEVYQKLTEPITLPFPIEKNKREVLCNRENLGQKILPRLINEPQPESFVRFVRGLYLAKKLLNQLNQEINPLAPNDTAKETTYYKALKTLASEVVFEGAKKIEKIICEAEETTYYDALETLALGDYFEGARKIGEIVGKFVNVEGTKPEQSVPETVKFVTKNFQGGIEHSEKEKNVRRLIIEEVAEIKYQKRPDKETEANPVVLTHQRLANSDLKAFAFVSKSFKDKSGQGKISYKETGTDDGGKLYEVTISPELTWQEFIVGLAAVFSIKIPHYGFDGDPYAVSGEDLTNLRRLPIKEIFSGLGFAQRKVELDKKTISAIHFLDDNMTYSTGTLYISGSVSERSIEELEHRFAENDGLNYFEKKTISLINELNDKGISYSDGKLKISSGVSSDSIKKLLGNRKIPAEWPEQNYPPRWYRNLLEGKEIPDRDKIIIQNVFKAYQFYEIPEADKAVIREIFQQSQAENIWKEIRAKLSELQPGLSLNPVVEVCQLEAKLEEATNNKDRKLLEELSRVPEPESFKPQYFEKPVLTDEMKKKAIEVGMRGISDKVLDVLWDRLSVVPLSEGEKLKLQARLDNVRFYAGFSLTGMDLELLPSSKKGLAKIQAQANDPTDKEKQAQAQKILALLGSSTLLEKLGKIIEQFNTLQLKNQELIKNNPENAKNIKVLQAWLNLKIYQVVFDQEISLAKSDPKILQNFKDGSYISPIIGPKLGGKPIAVPDLSIDFDPKKPLDAKLYGYLRLLTVEPENVTNERKQEVAQIAADLKGIEDLIDQAIQAAGKPAQAKLITDYLEKIRVLAGQEKLESSDLQKPLEAKKLVSEYREKFEDLAKVIGGSGYLDKTDRTSGKI